MAQLFKIMNSIKNYFTVFHLLLYQYNSYDYSCATKIRYVTFAQRLRYFHVVCFCINNALFYVIYYKNLRYSHLWIIPIISKGLYKVIVIICDIRLY